MILFVKFDVFIMNACMAEEDGLSGQDVRIANLGDVPQVVKTQLWLTVIFVSFC